MDGVSWRAPTASKNWLIKSGVYWELCSEALGCEDAVQLAAPSSTVVRKALAEETKFSSWGRTWQKG